MITNPRYKLYCGQIAKLFCPADQICEAAVKQRMIANFNDQTFEYFLQNIQIGRFYVLEYSNWRTGSNCRKMLIDVKLTDAITGQVVTGYWHYDNADCGDKQYYYPDLNTLISRMGNVLLDPPITTKTTADIKKPRLIYNNKKPAYGITYTPQTPGSGGGGSQPAITATPPANIQQPPLIQTPLVNTTPETKTIAGFDLKTILIIAGVGVAAFLFLKK